MKIDKLESYKILVPFLGQALGADYEVALQKVSEGDFRIVAIANGHISGRKVGAPLTDFALQLIKEKKYLEHDFIVGYSGKSKSGERLRSSTFFIKDGSEILGMLCINHDCSKILDITNSLLSLVQEPQLTLAESYSNTDDPTKYIETFPESIADLINSAAGIDLSNNPVKLSSDDNKRIVKVLEQKGIFQLKGAVSEVAVALKISEATLYRYLKNI
ncbi:helix-turn-helix transcriptional regulator [Streptococcus marmotae]|uniref:helix-turn-helix transcriptional regulator n=1 Tax=Streptococcus marmotae TaxID=1825069 RepID=UPI00082D8B5F|nr:PAS domain-containing protein [Streptococcus marmotae]